MSVGLSTPEDLVYPDEPTPQKTKGMEWVLARPREEREEGDRLFQEMLVQIKADKIPVFFVSPHFDDQAASAAELTKELSESEGMEGNIHVITVFTNGTEATRNPLTERYFPPGIETVEELYRTRAQEDERACQILGAVPHILRRQDRSLFNDALFRDIGFRRVPAYPFDSFALGRIFPSDRALPGQIGEALREEITRTIGKEQFTKGKYVVVGPIAVKGKIRAHVDHVVTQRAVTQVFPENAIYYGDYPYIIERTPSETLINEQGLRPTVLERKPQYHSARKEAIEAHRSQRQLFFFNSKLPPLLPQEIYFISSRVVQTLRGSSRN